MSITGEVVNRCLALIPLIREHQGITLDELARMARLPKDQIAGELGAVLLMCGVPPYFPHDYIGFFLDGDRVRIHFADHFRRPVSLSPLEALALKLACESLAPPGKGTPRVVANLLRKVEEAMAPEQRQSFRNLARRVAVKEEGHAPGGVAARVALAVARRKVMRIAYLSPGRAEPRTRGFEPYGLLSRDGRWYVVGRDRGHETVVTLRLDRIQSAAPREESFEIPAGFRLDDYARGPLIPLGEQGATARVRFDGPGARWVRETATPDSLEPVPGDPQQVVWRHPLRNESALAAFFVGFGEDAEVLEPPSLRERVRESLEAVARAHGEGGGGCAATPPHP